jgi:hypothetical protein
MKKTEGRKSSATAPLKQIFMCSYHRYEPLDKACCLLLYTLLCYTMVLFSPPEMPPSAGSKNYPRWPNFWPFSIQRRCPEKIVILKFTSL